MKRNIGAELVARMKDINDACDLHAAENQRLQPDRPTLTDAEREAIEMAADDNRYHQDPGGRAAHIERTLRGLLERTK